MKLLPLLKIRVWFEKTVELRVYSSALKEALIQSEVPQYTSRQYTSALTLTQDFKNTREFYL